MLIRYCVFYFVITFVIAAISLYLPFRYSNSATAGDLTSILFFGIMISGYLLNLCLKVMKKAVAIISMFFITVGFVMMSVTSEVIIVGIGILISTFFYGIAQPYYYDRLSLASSRIALTLTLAWFAVMDSIGNVVAAPLIDLIVKLFHKSTTTDPNLAFWLCTVLSFIGLVIVIIRKIIVGVKDHVEEDKKRDELLDTAKPALNPAGHGAAVSHVLAVAVANGQSIDDNEPKPFVDATQVKAPKFVPADSKDAAEAAAEAAQQVASSLQQQATTAKAKEAAAEAAAQKAEQEVAAAREAAAKAEQAAEAAEQVAKAAEAAVQTATGETPAVETQTTPQPAAGTPKPSADDSTAESQTPASPTSEAAKPDDGNIRNPETNS